MNFKAIINPKELVFDVLESYVQKRFGEKFNLVRTNECTEIPDLIITVFISSEKKKMFQLIELIKSSVEPDYSGIGFIGKRAVHYKDDPRFSNRGYISEDLLFKAVDFGISSLLRDNGLSELADDSYLLNDFIILTQQCSYIRNFLNTYQRALAMYIESPCFEPDYRYSEIKLMDKEKQ